MTSLDRAIAHYKAIVKSGNRPEHGTAPLERHYALGALEVLERVKGLRDELREDMRRLWKQRGQQYGAELYYQTKEMYHCLNNLMTDETSDNP